ncbi:capping complex subunit for YIEGIA, partial [Metaclostridioides mangenotii]
KVSGGCPIFYAKDENELQNKAMLISKCVGGMVHDMTNGTLIVVKH